MTTGVYQRTKEHRIRFSLLRKRAWTGNKNPMKNPNIVKKALKNKLEKKNKINKEIYNETIKTIPEEIKQIILGSLLGDAGLQKTNKKGNATFRESHSLKQEDYLLWKEKVLSKFFGKFKRYYHKNKEMVSISSKAHPFFTELYKIFYPNTTKKIIPIEALNQLNPLGLAVWYFDDGALISCGCCLCISYKKDKKIVKEKLKEIFNLNVKINKDIVYFNVKEADKFIKLISPYAYTNDIKYKLNLFESRTKTREIGKKNYWKNPEKNRKNALKYYYKNKR